MKYEILKGYLKFGTAKELIKAVDDKMSDGWECQGGIAIHEDGFGTTFYQAMVKK